MSNAKKRKERVANPELISLLDFPNEMLLAILNRQIESTSILANFARTGKTYYAFFQSEIDQRAAKKLLGHVLKGEEAEANVMIAANPRLLFIKTEAVDYSGRSISGSPFQAALGANDIDMCKMMEAYIDQITNGREEALQQFEEQLPGFNGERDKHTYHFETLVTAISAERFIGGKFSDKTEAALNQLREDFKPGLVTHGKHFPINILLDAVKIYLDNDKRWNLDQRLLFLYRVIGYLQRFLPACYAQAICQGLSDLIDPPQQPLIRTLVINNRNSQIKYFPLDADSRFCLGANFVTYGAPSVESTSSYWRAYCSRMEKLSQAKAFDFVEFKQRLQNPPIRLCVVF